jgi:hypothetical protein
MMTWNSEDEAESELLSTQDSTTLMLELLKGDNNTMLELARDAIGIHTGRTLHKEEDLHGVNNVDPNKVQFITSLEEETSTIPILLIPFRLTEEEATLSKADEIPKSQSSMNPIN